MQVTYYKNTYLYCNFLVFITKLLFLQMRIFSDFWLRQLLFADTWIAPFSATNSCQFSFFFLALLSSFVSTIWQLFLFLLVVLNIFWYRLLTIVSFFFWQVQQLLPLILGLLRSLLLIVAKLADPVLIVVSLFLAEMFYIFILLTIVHFFLTSTTTFADTRIAPFSATNSCHLLLAILKRLIFDRYFFVLWWLFSFF